AEDGIRDRTVTGVQTCALPISFGRSRLPFREAGVSQMLGFAAVGTPLCPTPDLATPVPGTPALPGNPSAACVLNVTGSDHINLKIGRASCRERVERQRVACVRI